MHRVVLDPEQESARDLPVTGEMEALVASQYLLP
jgi:hypothetical protein